MGVAEGMGGAEEEIIGEEANEDGQSSRAWRSCQHKGGRDPQGQGFSIQVMTGGYGGSLPGQSGCDPHTAP